MRARIPIASIAEAVIACLLLACAPRSAAPPEASEVAAPEAREGAVDEAVLPVAEPPEAPAAAPEPETSGSFTEELRLESAPFSPPGDAPSVLVHAGPAFDPEAPLRLVVFLHGWSGCIRQLAGDGPTRCRSGDVERAGWGLTDRYDEAGGAGLLVFVQLAYLERDGAPGGLNEPGRFRAVLSELLERLGGRLGARTVDALDSVTLLAHSAGFESALAVLARGAVTVDHVVLFDALYRGVEPFARWLAGAPERRLVSLYTGSARTATQSARLAQHVRGLMGPDAVSLDVDAPLADQVRSHALVVARARAPHGEVPARYLREVLAPLGLAQVAPPRAGSAGILAP